MVHARCTSSTRILLWWWSMMMVHHGLHLHLHPIGRSSTHYLSIGWWWWRHASISHLGWEG